MLLSRPLSRWGGRPAQLASAASLTAALLGLASASTACSDARPAEECVVEKTTGLSFPKSIYFKDGSEHVLVGIGPRQITFLKLSVYGVGIYVEKGALTRTMQELQSMPSDTTAPGAAVQHDMDATLKRLFIDAPVEMSLKIVPFRSTTGAHMRNGFSRGLTQKYTRIPDLKPEAAKAIHDEIEDFKKTLPRGNVAKGAAILIRRLANGDLEVYPELPASSSISGPCVPFHSLWVGSAFFEGYIANERPISPKAKAAFVEFVQSQARPPL